MAEQAPNATLNKWLKSQDIYDNDVSQILSDQGISDPKVDFKKFTQKNWDTLWRKAVVERSKELKDSTAKLRLENKMTKLEKFWRKESGIKKTSMQKSSNKNKKKDNEEKKDENKGQGLKKFMQKNQCFDKDLLAICIEAGVESEETLTKIDSNSAFDKIKRKVVVLRAKELKDSAAKLRLEKLITKFEKLWRAKTDIKKKSSVQSSNKNNSGKKDPKTAANDKLETSGKELKAWMKKNSIWENALFDELVANDIESGDQIKDMTEDKFDAIVRKVRVDRFSQLKDHGARQRADKLLIAFEKLWRSASGIKKTSIK